MAYSIEHPNSTAAVAVKLSGSHDWLLSQYNYNGVGIEWDRHRLVITMTRLYYIIGSLISHHNACVVRTNGVSDLSTSNVESHH